MFSHRFLFCLFVSAVCLFPAAKESLAAGDQGWRPVDQADLSLKSPLVDKDADAEAIFWEVRVADDLENSDPRTVLNHYIRIKIFTERGRESQSKIDITYLNNTDIKDIAARTIKPDGTIVELKKADVFEKTIVKLSGIKLKAKSFVMPAVEPGAIIEYRWREVRNNTFTFYDRFDLQREIPVRLVKYYLKPGRFDTYTSIGMNARTFNGDTTPFTKEKDGYHSTTMSNVPAFKEEPRMPPEDQIRAWMLVYYTMDEVQPAEKFWPKVGREVHDYYKDRLKANDEVKKVAAELTANAATADEKLRRLFDFCRTKIKNVNDDASGMTNEERAKVKENKNAADTLKRGVGTGEDIDVLFAALANASGLDARITRISDRGRIFFDRRSTDRFMLNGYNVAVKVDDSWRFFDPASKYVPFGMLRWQEENQDALVPDAKQPSFVRTPLSAPEKSKQKRSAKFKLSEDGTIEGEVRVEYTGHFAAEMKEQYDENSAAEREENLRDRVRGRISSAELTDIRIDNVSELDKPFAYSYRIRAAGYAQRTGKRLFLQPAFFEHGVSPMFSSAERKYPIYFSFPWTEEDEVMIELPAGYSLDNADAPAPFSAGGISEYKPSLGISTDGRLLVYKRNFFFGGKGNILFDVGSYSQLKTVFDALHQQDNHVITLKQGSISP